jgi:hypothetical protein
MVHNYAVQFGHNAEHGLKGNAQAWPFIYTFRNTQDVNWDVTKKLTGNPSLAFLGPIVPGQGLVRHNVQLDPDFIFKLLYIQYSIYAWAVEPPQAGVFAWHHPNLPGLWVDPTQPESSVSARLDQYLRINVQFQPQGRWIYGQHNNLEQTANLRDPQPISPHTLQGYEYGPSYTRTPILLPPNGHLHFEIYNDNAYDVVVAAAIYGMKVRM